MSALTDNLRKGHCGENMGCNAMAECACDKISIAAERIEALEAALFDALSGLRYVRVNYPGVSGVGFDRAEGYQSLLSEYRK